MDMSEYTDGWQAPRPAASAEALQPAGRHLALGAVIGRIEEAIDTETAALRGNPRFDLKESNARKSRHLYELNKVIKSLQPDQLRQEDRLGIRRLREKLSTNEAVIKAHLGAVTEVAALVQDAIERHEADGTYSSSAFGRARDA